MEKIPLLLIFLGHVWVDASQNILPVALAILKDSFGLSYFQVGAVMMTLNLTSSVIQPVFGHISDRVKTGWFVPIGILWTSVAMGLLGWVPNYITVLLLVALSGLGTAAFHPRAMMAVHLVSGKRRGFGQAIFATGGNLGFAIGPMIGSFLLLGFGMHATFAVIIPGLLLVIVIFAYRGDFLKRTMVPHQTGPDASDDRPFSIPWVALIALCLIVTLRSWVYISFITYLPMFLEKQGIALKSGSLMLTVFLACGAATGLYGGHLSDRIGRLAVIVGSMLLYPLLMSGFILSNGIWLWILCGAAGAALLASFSVTVVQAQEFLPRHIGLASGLIMGLSFGTGGIGSALSGYLADIYGLNTAVWVLALAPLLCVPLAALMRTGPKLKQPSFA
jgi:FSR family fosmidomycin resistance protein-like MFS transporter